MSMMFKSVIYDLDGTLADTFHDIAEAANQGLAACGRGPLSVPEWKELVGYGMRNLLRWALGGGKNENGQPIAQEPQQEEITKAIEVTQAYYARHPVKHTKLYPGVLELVAELSQKGIWQGVLTNKPHDLAVQTVHEMGLDEWMDDVMGESRDFPAKPEAASLMFMMNKTQGDRKSTLMVGDSETDALTARGAAVPICLVTYGARPKSLLKTLEPNWIVDDFSEIRKIILEENDL